MRRAIVFAVPGDLATPTGGYVYDRRIIAELGRLGWQVEVLDLGGGFPQPREQARHVAETRLAAAPKGLSLVVDGLAFGVLPEAAARLRATHRLVPLVHHPLAFESGLPEQQRAALYGSEKDALAQVNGVIVTSAATKEILVANYSVPANMVSVVQPGQDRVPAATGGDGATVCLLGVGAIVPRKGYDVLIAALAMLKDLTWTLTIVGDRNRDRAAAARLDDDIRRHGLGDRVRVAGAVSDEHLAQYYIAADLFVLASRFEGYGMAYADAISYGLPVIGTTAGAIPEAVPAEASILVPPGDISALAAALRRLIESASERRALAENARRAALRLPTWQEQGAMFARAVEAIA